MSLVIEKLSAGYGGYPVLKDFSIEVPLFEPTALVGPNGIGKSTLFLALVSQLPAKSGRVIFNGRDISSLSTSEIVKCGITLIPEGRPVFSRMTISDNLRVGAYSLDSRRKYKERLEQVLEAFPLFRERSNQMAGSLSGGEQQLLVVARGLMSNPKLLLVDEPFLGLAPAGIHTVSRALSRIQSSGVAVFVTSESDLPLSKFVQRIERFEV
jgi:branched-chain amino acid transport system ATP-binding protein